MEQQPLLTAETPEVREARRAAQKEQRRAEAAAAPARVVSADRQQLELRPMDLDSLLPLAHRARALWDLVERLDLTAFYGGIKARGSWAGRDATDPKVLLALWLYATAEGVGSARELERLCAAHAAYRWLRGGVSMNYHTLSTFRTAHGAALDTLLTQVLAVMMNQGLVRLKRMAQDGTRVRAAAGDGSFRRRARLEDFTQQAAAQVQALRTQLEAPAAPPRSARQRAAQERAVRERQQRVEQALAELAIVEQERAQYKPGAKEPKGAARASTTDPAARTMRMADGGRRPAYNVQFATDTESEVIVGVAVSQRRTDFAEAVPMVDQLTARLGGTAAAVSGRYRLYERAQRHCARDQRRRGIRGVAGAQREAGPVRAAPARPGADAGVEGAHAQCGRPGDLSRAQPSERTGACGSEALAHVGADGGPGQGEGPVRRTVERAHVQSAALADAGTAGRRQLARRPDHACIGTRTGHRKPPPVPLRDTSDNRRARSPTTD